MQHIDPYFNLAAEEYFLKNFSENCFKLWQNKPSVIVGRHQNTLAEINLEYVESNHIKVVRRLSGGGAVFHDMGNLNFTFIENATEGQLMDFQKYVQPIIAVLQQLGIDARFEGRNDISIDGKKISGNAEHVYRNRVLHHGTLLFSSELTDLSGALNANPLKFQDKAIKSVKSRVTNISSHLDQPLGLNEFRDMIFDYMLRHYDDCRLYQYTKADIAAISKLRDEKYTTWDWNFGQSPKYSFVRGSRTQGGHLEIHLDVKDGRITALRVLGDFFHIKDIAELEELFLDTLHREEDIREKLGQIQLSDYLVNISVDELVATMF